MTVEPNSRTQLEPLQTIFVDGRRISIAQLAANTQSIIPQPRQLQGGVRQSLQDESYAFGPQNYSPHSIASSVQSNSGSTEASRALSHRVTPREPHPFPMSKQMLQSIGDNTYQQNQKSKMEEDLCVAF